MPQDSGLVKRGLLLLALMSALVVVLLTIMFQRSGPGLPASVDRPELLAAVLVRSDASFPAAVSWSGLYRFGEAFPSAPGWLIRYNAAGALARRGSDNVPWDVLREMLDESRQMHNFRVQLRDGRLVPDEAAARLTVLSALKAIAEWHKKQTAGKEASPELAPVYAAVNKLAGNPVMEIKSQAENTRKLFFK
jgi:hypothetical protein